MNKGHENIKSFMTVLDKHLLDKTYLVGESVTLADLTLAVYMRDLYSMVCVKCTCILYIVHCTFYT